MTVDRAAQFETHIRYREARRASDAELELLRDRQATIQTQGQRIAALEAIITTIHIYSRRYCDGRSTYAPADHNLATHRALALGLNLPHDPISLHSPFAADGMYGLTERELQALERLRQQQAPSEARTEGSHV